MSITVTGVVVDEDGCATYYRSDYWGDLVPDRVESTPAATFGPVQPSCPISVGHGGEVVGEVHYLERGYGGDEALRFVGTVDVDDMTAEELGALTVSAEINAWMDLDGLASRSSRLTGLAICPETAGLGVGRLSAVEGDYRHSYEPGKYPWHRVPGRILDRAFKAHHVERRRVGDGLVIRRPPPEPSGRIRYSGGQGSVLAVR